MLSTPISIVIPTKDGGRDFVHLCRHLAHLRIRHQLDVLVIDSGSTDGTAQVAEQAGLRVRRIAPEKFGHGKTRNLGVRMAEGEIVCFLT
ncbi:MAG: glycosyltransferase family 2 protein, partial [Longimicrobiaceae bacterium]